MQEASQKWRSAKRPRAVRLSRACPCRGRAGGGRRELLGCRRKQERRMAARIRFFSRPPVVVVQFDSFTAFLQAAAGGGALAENAKLLARSVWDRLDTAMALDVAESDDNVARSFTETLPSDFTIFDLRSNAVVPRGFAWGRHGATSESRRAGDEPLFAVEGNHRGNNPGCACCSGDEKIRCLSRTPSLKTVHRANGASDVERGQHGNRCAPECRH